MDVDAPECPKSDVSGTASRESKMRWDFRPTGRAGERMEPRSRQVGLYANVCSPSLPSQPPTPESTAP